MSRTTSDCCKATSAIAGVFAVAAFVSGAEALTNYQAAGTGMVTILSWTDATMIPTFDPKPPSITVASVDPNTTLEFDNTSGNGGPNTPTYHFDPNVGDVSSMFSLSSNTIGSINPPTTTDALSEWRGSAEIELTNSDSIDYLVDIRLDWDLMANTFTNSPTDQFGTAAAAIELSAYTGTIFAEFVLSETGNNDGLVQLSGSNTFTVRIPANGMDDITVTVELFGEAGQMPAIPEPMTLGWVGLAVLGYSVGLRRPGRTG